MPPTPSVNEFIKYAPFWNNTALPICSEVEAFLASVDWKLYPRSEVARAFVTEIHAHINTHISVGLDTVNQLQLLLSVIRASCADSTNKIVDVPDTTNVDSIVSPVIVVADQVEAVAKQVIEVAESAEKILVSLDASKVSEVVSDVVEVVKKIAEVAEVVEDIAKKVVEDIDAVQIFVPIVTAINDIKVDSVVSSVIGVTNVVTETTIKVADQIEAVAKQAIEALVFLDASKVSEVVEVVKKIAEVAEVVEDVAKKVDAVVDAAQTFVPMVEAVEQKCCQFWSRTCCKPKKV